MSALVLGLDPATSCGWALVDEDGHRIGSGVWELTRCADHAERVEALDSAIRTLAGQYDGEIVAVVYEETNRHRSRAQARVGYGLEAVILLAAARYNWVALCCMAQHAKAAAGDRKADKAHMVAAARQRWGVACERSDEADALWIAEWGRTQLRFTTGGKAA